MPIDDRRGLALLRQLDDPDHWEFPRGYDDAATRTRFYRLVARLNHRFDCACAVDRVVEDAGYHGTITVPALATHCGRHITVTVSNFGNLTAVTLVAPGSREGDEEHRLFRSTDRPRVEGELEALGYVSISERLLWTRDASLTPRTHVSTWWVRFFDYL